ncbi:MAG TPA: hypothetical protein VMI06_16575 [Terriglobia bacterium]|nr:hypothetical protein [Terriglobia bacterium]
MRAESVALAQPELPAGRELVGTSTQPAKRFAQWVVMQLTALAEARQAAVTPQTLWLYAQALNGHAQPDISGAVEGLSMTPRGAGETAFPDLATLIAAVTLAKQRREEWARPVHEYKGGPDIRHVLAQLRAEIRSMADADTAI